jgi:hypothetical protein
MKFAYSSKPGTEGEGASVSSERNTNREADQMEEMEEMEEASSFKSILSLIPYSILRIGNISVRNEGSMAGEKISTARMDKISLFGFRQELLCTMRKREPF